MERRGREERVWVVARRRVVHMQWYVWMGGEWEVILEGLFC